MKSTVEFFQYFPTSSKMSLFFPFRSNYGEYIWNKSFSHLEVCAKMCCCLRYAKKRYYLCASHMSISLIMLRPASMFLRITTYFSQISLYYHGEIVQISWKQKTVIHYQKLLVVFLFRKIFFKIIKKNHPTRNFTSDFSFCTTLLLLNVLSKTFLVNN